MDMPEFNYLEEKEFTFAVPNNLRKLTAAMVFYLDNNKEFPFKLELKCEGQFRFILMPPKREDFEYELNAKFQLMGRSDLNEFTTSTSSTLPEFERFNSWFTDLMEEGGRNVTLKCKVDSVQLILKEEKELAQIRCNAALKEAAKSQPTFDFTVNVGDQSFPASKSLLTACSNVFAAMLTSNMKESQTSTVLIEDFNAPTVKAMLDCLHSGGKLFPTESEVLEDLYVIADKYHIVPIMDKVNELLIVNDETFTQRAIFAFKTNNEVIQKKLRRFSWRPTTRNALFESEEFATLQKNNPEVAAEIQSAYSKKRKASKQ